MLKKITSCLLVTAALFILAPAAFADEATVSVSQSGSFAFDVTLSGAADGVRYTIQLLDSDRTAVYYVGEGKASDGMVVFDRFSVVNTTPTGTYVVRVGDTSGKVLYSEDFQFTNVYLSVTALKELSAKLTDLKALADGSSDDAAAEAQTAVSASILNGYAALGIETGVYNGLVAGAQYAVNAYLTDFDFSLSEDEADAADKLALLQAEWSKVMEIADIMVCDDAEAVVSKLEAAAHLTFELDTYYAKLADKSYVGAVMAGYPFGEDGIRLIYDRFDGAVLMGVIKQLDWATVKEALAHYEEKGLLTLDYTEYDELSDDAAKAQVYKDLKKIDSDDYLDVPAYFSNISAAAADEGESGRNGGSSGGSSGAGSSYSYPYGTVTSPADEAVQQGSGTPSGNAGFTDLGTAAWAAEAITYLYEINAVDGRGNDLFVPDGEIYREEFAKIVVCAMGMLEAGAVSEYSDIDAAGWEYPFVSSVTKAGIMEGIGNGAFGKGQSVTRQDMAVVLYRICQAKGAEAAEGEADEFTDSADISGYAQEAVRELSRAGVINGMGDGSFQPRAAVTRAQAAKAIYETLRLASH